MGSHLKLSLLASHFRLATQIDLHERTAYSVAVSRPCIRFLLSAAIAFSILQSTPAPALTLSELRVQSGVGQPFNATTTAQIGAGEKLTPGCISSVNPNSGLKTGRNFKVTAPTASQPGTYTVQVSSSQFLHEPMYHISLQANCPGTTVLQKNYIVMLGLPTAESGSPQAATPQPEIDTSNLSELPGNISVPAAPAATTPGKLEPDSSALSAGQSYRVRKGDTLSGIAAKISPPTAETAQAVGEQIFSLNPDAFLADDPALIKLGSLIEIPTSESPTQIPAHEAPPTTLAEPQTEPQNILPANPGPEPATETTQVRVESEIPAPVEQSEQVEPRMEQAAVTAVANSPAPKIPEPAPAVVAESAPPAETPMEPASALPAEPAATPTEIIVRPEVTPEAPAQNLEPTPLVALAWGALVGLILAVLLFGRSLLAGFKSRTRHSNAPATPESAKPAAVTPVLEQYAAEPHSHEEALANIAPGDKPRGGVAVEEAEASAEISAVDSEVSAEDSALDFDLSDNADETDSAAESFAGGQLPRIKLGDEEDSSGHTADDSQPADDNTEFMIAPDLKAYSENTSDAADFDHENTMRDLFAESTPLADDAPTQELPDLTNAAAPTPDTDLASLMAETDTATDDENLTNTLTQALGLLEQDYEDELTASQILDAREVRAALEDNPEENPAETEVDKY